MTNAIGVQERLETIKKIISSCCYCKLELEEPISFIKNHLDEDDTFVEELENALNNGNCKEAVKLIDSYESIIQQEIRIYTCM